MEDADLRCLEIEQNYDDISKILRRFIDTVNITFNLEVSLDIGRINICVLRDSFI